MKVNANSAPATLFTVERHPQKAEMAIVTLCDNVTGPDDTGAYTFDAYQIIVPWRDGLTMQVAAHTTEWREAAKSRDAAHITQAAADAVIAQNEAAIDELLLLIGGDS